ncbi:MAG: 2-oxoacid:acceptor oxidoreductase family protein [Dehalococcoidales bacterium]|nr:2-oxoacid:acceptor oxidoreductase family protein [Dehalococcoidales bacterium]
MKEIRIHGRGGQGAVLAARMLASAFVREGKSVASFPMYGFERRGAPVVAFTRVDDKPIMEKTQIYNPDCLVVIDPGLLSLPTLFTGLKPESAFILNSPHKLTDQPNKNLTIGGVVNATQIAVDEIGRDIPNTCLLGAVAAATGWLKLQSILDSLPDYLSGDILERNLKSAERGYHEVEVIKW